MVHIYLARHGQNLDNVNGILNGHRDEPLTDLGIAQAKTTAQHIAESNQQFEAVYCSPLQRAHQTACIICTHVGTDEPVVLPELIERDFGHMTGKLIASIKELCAPDIIETDTITYFLSPINGETFPDIIERAKDLLRVLQNTHQTGSILLVTHGDIGKMIYAAYYDLPWKDVLINFHFGNCELLLLSPDSPADAAHVFTQEQHNH